MLPLSDTSVDDRDSGGILNQVDGLGGAGAVGAKQDRRAMPMPVWDLRQRLIGDLDVVGGGIGVRVPGPQHPAQRFPGVVQPGEQGVISIPCWYVAAAFCFSEWQLTKVASRSITKPGATMPAHRTTGTLRPASPRSNHARSRAAARATFT
jgi:hypothetical protein